MFELLVLIILTLDLWYISYLLFKFCNKSGLNPDFTGVDKLKVTHFNNEFKISRLL